MTTRGILLVGAALLALLAAAGPAWATEFTKVETISVADNGAASSSTNPVGGLGGLVTDVDVRLGVVAHNRPDDFDIELVSPDGTAVVLMSDACDSVPLEGGLTFDQSATAAIPDEAECGLTSHQPADHSAVSDTDAWPVTPDGTSLDLFNGENANGTWTLYITDDQAGQTGSVEDWTLDIDVGTSAVLLPKNESFRPSEPYPSDQLSDSTDVVITDLNVLLDGLTHEAPDQLDLFLEGPMGQRVWLMSDACNGRLTNVDFLVDDEAPGPFLDIYPCDGPTYRPADYDGGMPFDDLFDAPAPPLPAGGLATSLSAFDLTEPGGLWKLWATDDSEGSGGFLVGGWRLEMQTRPAAGAGFTPGTVTAGEGSTVSVDVVRSAEGPLGEATITAATSSGTAVAGEDFVPVADTLTFGPGETSKTVSVQVIDDGGGREPIQGFSIVLGNADGDIRVDTPAAAAITIPADPFSDDTPPNSDPPPPQAFNAANATQILPSTARCRRAGQTIRFVPENPSGVAVIRSEVRVNGTLIEENVGDAAIAPIVLTMQGRRMRVVIRLYSHDGRVVTIRRTFRRCPRKRR